MIDWTPLAYLTLGLVAGRWWQPLCERVWRAMAPDEPALHVVTPPPYDYERDDAA